MPWAEDVARRTGFAVRTAVLLLDDVVIIHHEPRPDGSRQMPEVGIVIPAHASALGKAILAFGGEAGQSALSDPLRSMTGETLTSRSALAEQLGTIRESGLAFEEEEALLGECGVAAPSSTGTRTSSERSASSSRPPPGRSTSPCGTRSATPRGPSRGNWAPLVGRRAPRGAEVTRPGTHHARPRATVTAMHLLLEYTLADDYLERRAALRDDHLALAREAHERGELLLAGALPDPYDRALLVWTAPRDVVERFAAADPYVTNGLVTGWTVRPWNVVIG